MHVVHQRTEKTWVELVKLLALLGGLTCFVVHCVHKGRNNCPAYDYLRYPRWVILYIINRDQHVIPLFIFFVCVLFIFSAVCQHWRLALR